MSTQSLLSEFVIKELILSNKLDFKYSHDLEFRKFSNYFRILDILYSVLFFFLKNHDYRAMS
jgi:hypothetical protein